MTIEDVQEKVESILEDTLTEEIKFLFDAFRLGLKEQNLINKSNFILVYFETFENLVSYSLEKMELRISAVIDREIKKQEEQI